MSATILFALIWQPASLYATRKCLSVGKTSLFSPPGIIAKRSPCESGCLRGFREKRCPSKDPEQAFRWLTDENLRSASAWTKGSGAL
jgi:hypothetical protein